MAKPIFVVRFNLGNSNFDRDIHSQLQKDLHDYHVLFATHTKNEIEFEVLNAINATDIEIEELKAKVFDEISRSL